MRNCFTQTLTFVCTYSFLVLGMLREKAVMTSVMAPTRSASSISCLHRDASDNPQDVKLVVSGSMINQDILAEINQDTSVKVTGCLVIMSRISRQ